MAAHSCGFLLGRQRTVPDVEYLLHDGLQNRVSNDELG